MSVDKDFTKHYETISNNYENGFITRQELISAYVDLNLRTADAYRGKGDECANLIEYHIWLAEYYDNMLFSGENNG